MLRRQIITALLGAAAMALSFGNAQAQDWKEPFPVKGKVTVVDFGAEWCASCPEMVKVMKDMQKEYGDRAAFVIIDIDKYKGIEDKYMIETMPSQMFYDAFGEPIWIHQGYIEPAELRERVDILIEGSKKFAAEKAAQAKAGGKTASAEQK